MLLYIMYIMVVRPVSISFTHPYVFNCIPSTLWLCHAGDAGIHICRIYLQSHIPTSIYIRTVHPASTINYTRLCCTTASHRDGLHHDGNDPRLALLLCSFFLSISFSLSLHLSSFLINHSFFFNSNVVIFILCSIIDVFGKNSFSSIRNPTDVF